MQRLRLYDVRLSRFPTVLGLCQADVNRTAEFVNAAQRRLLYAKEAGDEGWWGTFAEMAFNVSVTSPYLTLPREVARLEAVTVCSKPVKVHNQFFEYLQFGNGRLPKVWRSECCPVITEGFTRNSVPTFTDLTSPPQLVRVFTTDPADIESAKRVLIQGTDAQDQVIYSQDGLNQVSGIFLTFQSPFTTSTQTFKTITGIQKDITAGQVQIFQVDPTTGNDVLLLTMEPTEQTASYRRYYFNGLPRSCCFNVGTIQTLQLTAIVKLDLIPVRTDTDYCLIQNLEALTEEAKSIRYSEMDTTSAKTMAAEAHKQAIRLLIGELTHFIGKDDPALIFAPFGSARLERVRVGMI